MTTEPRQEALTEANKVVRSFALAARRTAEGHVSPETFKQRSDRLVDALAAAIKVSRADPYGNEYEDAMDWLVEALSALREDTDG